jgi:hypothetical protein
MEALIDIEYAVPAETPDCVKEDVEDAPPPNTVDPVGKIVIVGVLDDDPHELLAPTDIE